jgi:hypothetical protein
MKNNNQIVQQVQFQNIISKHIIIGYKKNKI